MSSERDVYELRAAITRMTAERDALRSALVDAVKVIRQWHAQGLRPTIEARVWVLYWRYAPELASARHILGELTPDELRRLGDPPTT